MEVLVWQTKSTTRKRMKRKQKRKRLRKRKAQRTLRKKRKTGSAFRFINVGFALEFVIL